ncbi:TPA: 1-phosphofructokinase family hexose kinase, partial [Vibrio cholerae O1]
FPGIQVTEADIEAFEATLQRLAQDHDYFVLAGSLPQGISPQRCAGWIAQLRSMNKKVLFDSSRDALLAGLDAKPWLIKPNDEELSQWCGRELTTLTDCQQAAAELAQKQIENIVISMGAEGVMWLHENQWLHAKPPKMQVVSTVGAGDTLVAGLCWGHMQRMEKESLLRFATALSALAVTQVGVGLGDREQLNTLQQQIQVSALYPTMGA